MKKFAKILSVVLCLAMVVSFAAMAFADETKTQITSLDQLTSGKYLIVCENDANLGVVDGTWVTNAESVWTLTVTDNGVTMLDAKGQYLAPKGGNSNGLGATDTEYAWTVVCTDGMFSFCGQGDDTVTLAFNSGESYLKFRGYKNSTVTGEKAAEYPSTFALYQVSDNYEVDAPATTAPQAPETTAPSAPVEQLQFVSAPVDGTAYKLGMTQVNLNKNLYLTGEMNGYYYAATENVEEAIDVYVENVEGGIKLYFTKDGAKNYLAIVINGTYTNVVFNETGSVFAYNAECNNLVTNVEGTDYYLGTYKTYSTFSASKTSYITAENTGVENFPAGLVAIETEVEPDPTEPVVPETTAPVAPETTAPVAPETTAPVVPETTAPVAPETTAPVAPETTAPVAESKTITIGDKTFTAEKWLYNTAVEAADAPNYGMIIFDKNYTGEVAINGWGAAIVLDKDGVLVKIYDAANMGFWTVDGKSADALTFSASDYSTVAFNELLEGETLILFANDGGANGNVARAWALGLRNVGGQCYCGQTAELTGFTFGTEEVPTTTVPTTQPGGDVDDTGDSSVVVLAVCLMMASAAVVVLVQKKRAF